MTVLIYVLGSILLNSDAVVFSGVTLLESTSRFPQLPHCDWPFKNRLLAFFVFKECGSTLFLPLRYLNCGDEEKFFSDVKDDIEKCLELKKKNSMYIYIHYLFKLYTHLP